MLTKWYIIVLYLHNEAKSFKYFARQRIFESEKVQILGGSTPIQNAAYDHEAEWCDLTGMVILR